ncbi:hypothetical protein [Prosthecodimorpha staleyi]|uniref:Uncharacterized protein n=1 Tax=Prosthecodimorpha staleyi TaxID=2840188 RepID=A0A947D425_9HYPH|nr:hypothetical protein [Prosthecodimorpha staleyi]MBT9290395.1 hypothetical protein [Prosthecodimorpha staleyi]
MSDDAELLRRILSFADASLPAGPMDPGFDIETIQGPDKSSRILRRLRSSSPGGLTFFNGYLKVYGVRGERGIDIRHWNAESSWKFAWPSDLRPYWCFAGTAMGEQFAVETVPGDGPAASAVYSLDPITMEPSVFASAMDDFFVLFSQGPEAFIYEDVYRDIVEKHGAIGMKDGVSVMPPRVFRRDVDAKSVFISDYRTMMTINGDCFSEASKLPVGAQVLGLTAYSDDQNRERIRFRVRSH